MKKKILAALLVLAMTAVPMSVNAESSTARKSKLLNAMKGGSTTSEEAPAEETVEEATEPEAEAEAPAEAPAEEGLVVVDKRVIFYPDSSSGLFIAKVANNGSTPLAIDNGKLVIFSDTDDILVSDDYVNTYPSRMNILPGGYAYVAETLWDDAINGATAGDVKYAITTEDGYEYEYVPATAEFEMDGQYHNYFYVTITNEGTEPIKGFYITSALLDEEGNILYVNDNCFDEITLHPGSTVTIRQYIDSDLPAYLNQEGITPASADSVVVVYQ